MKSICLILTVVLVLILGSVSCTALTCSQASDKPSYNSDEVRAIITQELKDITPPINEIYYYRLYQWELASHQILDIKYVGDGKWEVFSHASFDGYHKGFSVGSNSCALRWHFYEEDGTVKLVENELLLPEGAPPTFSRAEVVAIVGKHMSDMFYGDARLNFHDTSHWKLDYLGDGKWEVRLVIMNAVGLWHLDEKTETVQFLGRLGS
jgi:hypothetical protein